LIFKGKESKSLDNCRGGGAGGGSFCGKNRKSMVQRRKGTKIGEQKKTIESLFVKQKRGGGIVVCVGGQIESFHGFGLGDPALIFCRVQEEEGEKKFSLPICFLRVFVI